MVVTGVRPLVGLLCSAFAVLAGSLLLTPNARAAILLEEGPDSAKTSQFEWDFGDSYANVERVVELKWRNSKGYMSGNLATAGGGACGDPTEFWGQSYGNDTNGPAPVVAGARGSWNARRARTVEIESATPSGCSGDEPPIPVRTRYTYFDSGPEANLVRLERRFGFSATSETF